MPLRIQINLSLRMWLTCSSHLSVFRNEGHACGSLIRAPHCASEPCLTRLLTLARRQSERRVCVGRVPPRLAPLWGMNINNSKWSLSAGLRGCSPLPQDELILLLPERPTSGWRRKENSEARLKGNPEVAAISTAGRIKLYFSEEIKKKKKDQSTFCLWKKSRCKIKYWKRFFSCKLICPQKTIQTSPSFSAISLKIALIFWVARFRWKT